MIKLMQNGPESKDNQNTDSTLNVAKIPMQDESWQVEQIQVQSPKADEVSYRALIVDDNASFQKLMALTLSMQPRIGVIDCVGSGENAIEKAKTVKYDIIFMDAMMPGMDGYETCSHLREIPDYKYTPIIMVTGLTSPLDEAKAIIAGSTTYVTKPVQQVPFKELLTRVISLIEYKNTLNHT